MFLFIMLALLLFGLPLYGQDPNGLLEQEETEKLKKIEAEATSDNPPQQQATLKEIELKKEEPSDTWEQRLIKSNIAVSEWLDGVAEGLDLFLVGQKITSRPNATSVRIENTSLIQERQDYRNATSFKINLRLPNVEEYWQVKFSSYDETEERGAKETYLRQLPRETNYGATVGFFRKLGKVRTAFKPRLELRDPLNISHSLSFESVANFETFQFNPKVDFFATPEKGTGVFDALNFNFRLSEEYSLTWINQTEYEERSHLFTVIHGLSLGHLLSRDIAVAYNAFVTSNNISGYRMESYSFSTTFSHVLYKRILDYQIIPRLDFTKGREWQPVPGVNFNVSLNF